MKVLLLLVLAAMAFVLLGCLSEPVDECPGGQSSTGLNTCFSIENMDDYPDYTFYYYGLHNIPYLTEVEDGLNNPYKLDILNKFYAFPNGVSTYFIEHPRELTDAIVSREVNVPIGKSVYRITSFDSEAKQMVLKKVN